MAKCKIIVVIIFVMLSLVYLKEIGIGQDIELNIEPVVITAARISQELKNVGTNITVISNEEIKELKADNLGKVLSNLTAVAIGRQGTLGAVQSLSIRGCRSQQVLIMIDGRSVNSTSLGSADISQIPLDNIERIEIIRGANSSLYGANAVGGVINIITKKPESEAPLTDIYFSVGDFNTSVIRANFSQKKEKLDYFFSGGQDISNGWRENSDYENKNFSLRLGYKIPQFGKLSLTGGYYIDELGIPGPSNVLIDKWNGTLEKISSSPNARQETEKGYLSLEYQDAISENSTARLKLYGNEDIQTYINPDWLINDLRKNITKGIEGQYDMCLVRGKISQEISIGSDFHQDGFRQEDRNEWVDKISEKTVNCSIYIQDIINFYSLMAAIGVRYDKHSAYSEQINPRLSLVWSPFEGVLKNIKYSLNIGRAFRAPTFNELYWPYEEEMYWGTTYITQGNFDLKPEKAWSYDAGVEYRYKDILLSKLTIFQINTEDMIDWKQMMINSTTYKYQPENYLEGISQGIEIEFNHKISKCINQAVNYTYGHSEGKDEQEDGYKVLKFSPHHRANYKIKYNNDFGFGVVIAGDYVHKQWEQNGMAGMKLPSYTLLNIRITQKISEAELFLGIDNITDKKYMDRTDGFGKPYPLPGRTIFGGITLKFWD